MEWYLIFAYDSFQEEETPDRFVAMFEELNEAKTYAENMQRTTEWIEIVKLDPIQKTFVLAGSYLREWRSSSENFGGYYWKWSEGYYG